MSKKKEKASLKETLLGTKGIIWMSSVFGLFFLIVIFYQACAPRKGTILYGMCSAFLEQQVTFPGTLNYTAVEQYPKAVRIYFTYIDGFGQYQFELAECVFEQGEQGVMLDRVFFNYIKDITSKERVKGKGRLYEVEQKYIDLFNRSRSVQAIMSQDPDLALPEYRLRF